MYLDRHETKKRKKCYPSNLSDGAWRYLKSHLPVLTVGRPRELSLRQVVNAIFYVLKTGCQWRQLRREFPAWSAVYYHFYCGSRDRNWERLNHVLRSRLRQKGSRHKHPCGVERAQVGTARAQLNHIQLTLRAFFAWNGIATKPASLGSRRNLVSFGPPSALIWLIHFTNYLYLRNA